MEAPLDPYRPDLSIGHLFARSWPRFKDNLGLIVGAFAVYVLVTGGLGANPLVEDNGLFGLVAFVVAGPLAAGLYGLLLRLQRDESAELVDLFAGFQEFGRAFGVYALTTLAVMAGLVLLIVPGIVIAMGLWPGLYLVLDDDLGVTDTLREAWAMTRGYRWRLFVLSLVLGLVALAGLLALGVGFFFTGAFAAFVGAAAYEELALATA